MEQNYLMHYGRKGMKWGQRIFSKSRSGRKADPHDDYKKAHDKKKVKYMSDAELKARNNRLNAERQYRDLTKKTSAGKKVVQGLIATAGTIAAAETAYKTYARVANKVAGKMNDKLVNLVDLSDMDLSNLG